MIDRLADLRQASAIRERLEQQRARSSGHGRIAGLFARLRGSSTASSSSSGAARRRSPSPPAAAAAAAAASSSASPRDRLAAARSGSSDEDAEQRLFLERLDAVRRGPLRELEELLAEAKVHQSEALGAVAAAAERSAMQRAEACAERASGAASRTCAALQELAPLAQLDGYGTSANASIAASSSSGAGVGVGAGTGALGRSRGGSASSSDASLASARRRFLSATEAGLRRQSFAGVSVLFHNAMTAYFQSQQAFRAAMEAKVSRQLRLAFPDADDAALAAVAAGRRSAASAIEDALLQQPGTAQPLRSALAVEDARERFDELEHLVRSARELRQAFLDVESLVSSQGELIDDIGRQLQATRIETKTGTEVLRQAADLRRRIRWRRCLLLTLLGVVATIVIVYVAEHDF